MVKSQWSIVDNQRATVSKIIAKDTDSAKKFEKKPKVYIHYIILNALQSWFLMAFLCCYLTHANEAAARLMADHLLTERLIACANIFPVTSAYWWQGAVQQENEWVSVVKTTLDLEPALEAAVQRMHSYEVPCIMRFEVRANEAYEQWISESVKKASV